MSSTISMIVHGGAWSIPDELDEDSRKGVIQAVEAGYAVLRNSGTALDAVEAAIQSLEDNIAFDAGTGSVLNGDGNVELDAMIMNGETLECGAVAAINGVKHPISVARRVMEKTDHCLLVGTGAKAFATSQGFEHVDDDELVTAEARREFENYKTFGSAVNKLMNHHDTVGAVAFDCHGHLATGTSTGGITGKQPGRVGDSPLVGSGGYADDTVGACSTTGHGESILKVNLAFRTAQALSDAEEPSQTCRRQLHYMWERVKGRGGVILIDSKGRVGHWGTSTKMAWASATGSVGQPPETQAGIDNTEAFRELK